MKIQFLILSFISFLFQAGEKSTAQNLVPNESFELMNACPVNNYGEINKLKSWYDWVVSADYYNCSIGVPTNMFGYQMARTGSGYIGFGHGERVAIRLTQSLEAGKIYLVSLYVSAANNTNFSNGISVMLSPDSLCLHSTRYDTYRLSNGFPLNDSVNWIHLTDTLTASGCEKFLGLDIPDFNFSYYYFDDISLVCVDPSGCTPPVCTPPYTEIIPNVFSPNNDGINDQFKIKLKHSEVSNFRCVIFDRWGNEVASLDNLLNYWDGTTNGKNASDGVYYFLMEYTITECGEWYSAQGFIHLSRD